MIKEILHMKIDAELKQELKLLAEAEHRNLSNFVGKVLFEYVEQRKNSASGSSLSSSGERRITVVGCQ